MTKSHSSEESEPERLPPPPLDFVTLDDFASVDVNAIVADVSGFGRWDVDLPFIRAATEAEGAGDPVRYRVLRLMANILSMRLQVESEGDAFAPRYRGPDCRTMIPDDFREAQAQVLSDIAPTLSHPTVRARVADVAYDSGVGRAGLTAIDAYCEITDCLIRARSAPSIETPQHRVIDVVDPLTRAFAINARVAKRGTVINRLERTTRAAADFAIWCKGYVAFAALGRLLLAHRITDANTLAIEGEDLARSAPPADYSLAIKDVWLFAAEAHEKAGNIDASKLASINAIERTLGMKDQVGSSAAKAHWVKHAIREFRGLGGCQDRIVALKSLLRELQDASLDEFRVGRIKAEGVEELREAAAARVADCGLAEGMKLMMDYLEPPDLEAEKKAVLDGERNAPLSNLFASSHMDDQGRVIAEGPALAADEPSEAWYKEHCTRARGIARRITAFGIIEPVRRTLVDRFPVQERHMAAIAAYSPFIPPGHQHIFALGLARLWQGDYLTAASLLIPQLENSLRHVLRIAGHDTAKMEKDGIEGDRPLSVLLSIFRAELEEIFGANMVWEIDGLFAFRPGPALRHELAHGKLVYGAYYSSETVFACWLIYALTVLPIDEIWESLVVPMMEGGVEPSGEPSVAP